MEKEGDTIPVMQEEAAEDTAPSNWMRVRIIENAEVNNVRFPAGVVIDAFTEDAQRLVDSGKAEIINDDSGLDDLADVVPESSAEDMDKNDE